MDQLRHRQVLSVFAVCLHLASARAQELPPASAQNLDGKRIASITFDPARQPLELSEIREILPLKPDDLYRPAAVRRAIERLYATGRYRDIQVDATPVADRVALRFITTNSWFTGHVSVEGSLSDPPSHEQLAGAAGLELGLPYDPAQVTAGEENLRRMLLANGYLNATVSHREEPDTTWQQINVVYLVNSGKRIKYKTPEFKGDMSVLSAHDATRATGWPRFLVPGYRGITQNRTRTGVDNIRAKYQTANRLKATVTLDGIRPDGTPLLTVDPGSIVEVHAEGAKVSRSTLKQHVPIFEERTVDADLLAEGANNLRDYFQARGYFEAEVEAADPETRDGKTVLTYTINLGQRHRLAHVEVQGNRYFNTQTIRERLFLVPASFDLRLGRYSEALRRRDEQAIAELYRSNGFSNVKVTSRTEDDYNGKNGDVAAFFMIEEGPQLRVSSLRIEGANKLDLSRTASTLSSQQGQVFSEFNIAADRETVIQAYGAAGFAGVTFEWESSPGATPNTVDLKFVIGEGERQTVRDVAVTGFSTTSAKLVQKQIGLRAGDPLSPAAMAETQRRLYDLGIFARVNMAVQNPDGDERTRTVLYDLDEASRYSLTGGFGAEFARIGGSAAVSDLSDPGGAAGFSPRVSLDLARLNFLGRGQTVSLQTRLSTLQRRAAISYFLPRVFGLTKFDANVSLFYDDTHDVKTFRSKREEFSAQFVQHESKSITMFYRFNYRNVGVSNLKIDPLLLPRLAQSVRVGVAAFNLVQDRRDDPTDPHKGVYNTIDVGLAARAFGSQTSFVRILGRNATYYRLTDKLTLARETQFGIQPAFTNSNAGDATDPIPLPERYYGGGGSGLRAFPENQAGPRDLLTGFPLGGSALFFNNIELRFPLYGSNINGVVFEDAGNIYTSLGKMSLRTEQHSLADFNYMVHAAGFGVRYRTPVGPLRFDFAYSINPPRYNGFPGSYAQLVACSAVGAATPCQASIQQISHFQFFFSIGQAF